MAIFNNITDGGDLKNALSGKVDLSGSNADFGNLSSTAKTNIANTGIPDYTQAKRILNGFIATSNGFIFACNIVLNNNTATLKINNVLVGRAFGGSTAQDPTSMYAIVKKGDVITFTNMDEVIFYPFINNI